MEDRPGIDGTSFTVKLEDNWYRPKHIIDRMKLTNFKLSDCPVPILQDEWEFKTFLEMYINKAPKKVVEIGSFYGATLWAWINYSYGSLEDITSVDLSIPKSDGRYDEMIKSKQLWKKWELEYDVKFTAIEGNSHDSKVINQVKELYPNKDVDMLFIDADHIYSAVKADYNNYKDLVRPGGWIVFHDCIGIGDVNRLWREIKAEPDAKTIEISRQEFGWGIGIKEV